MTRPNILLITSDQQHWTTLGILNPAIHTPHLDRLAAGGMLFHRAYCPNPTCTPTRGSLITGKYPSQHGGWTLGVKVPESEPTVGDLLQAHGYRTSLVGKAHFQPLKSTEQYPSLESYPLLQDLDFWRTFHGPFYGFDHIELARNHTDEAHVGQHYALWMEEKGLPNWRDYYRPPTGTKGPEEGTWEIPEEFHYNTWIAERTCALLDSYQQNDESFFCWASFFDPHPPYLVPRPYDTLYDPATLTLPQATPGEHTDSPPYLRATQLRQPDMDEWKDHRDGQGTHGVNSHLHDPDHQRRMMATYYGMVTCMDKAIGTILDRLEASGQADNTLVVFSTDHGHFFGQHGLIAKGPFHYEDVIKVPYIVRWPGRVAAGAESQAIQSLVDLPVSFLAACDIPVPTDMTGVNQLPVWTGAEAAVRDHTIVEFHHCSTEIHVRTYIDAQYKLTLWCDRPYGELYDLVADPGELHNRWDDPAAKDLKGQLLEKLLAAELAKEEAVPAHLASEPQKSEKMYAKTVKDADGWSLTVTLQSVPAESGSLGAEARGRAGTPGYTLTRPQGSVNLWDAGSGHGDVAGRRQGLVRKLIDKRLRNEPLWMPRIGGA